MSSSDERLHLLVDQNIADLNRAWPNRIPSHIARRLARPFAEKLIRFDQLVEERGLVAGAEFLLRRRARGVEVSGRVPASGPVVVLANHPGLADAMALWKAIGREDLATLAAPRDLLRALPAVHARLREMEPNSGISGLRAMISELRKGRAVLTFPAGGIEPDPALEPDAAAEHRAA
ncbi:MAG: hypothetical protein MH204_04300, partial [Fimbriimonadaceae bacterium]|nr:hypothetical protein [Fimbriimonadaceae bacterium]